MGRNKIKSLITGICRRGVNRGVKWASMQVYQEILVRRLDTDIFDYNGKHILSEDFDVLVLLDACRVDALESVASEYRFLPTAPIERRISVAGNSIGWMENTFQSKYDYSDVAYITGNPHSEIAIEANNFATLDEVWKYAWDHSLGTIPPRPLTDRAIDTWRNESQNKMIIHYMQPHFPSLARPDLQSGIDLDGVGGKWEGNIWDRLLNGQVSREEVWEAYIENLRQVLNDIKLLRRNLDASKVIISADHGNAFGERGFYGHGDFRVPCVRRIPWVEIEAADEQAYSPEILHSSKEVDDEEIASRLESLGYID